MRKKEKNENNFVDSIKFTIPFMSNSVNSAYDWSWRRFKSKYYKEFEEKMDNFFKELYKENWYSYEILWNEFLKVSYVFHFSLFCSTWRIRKKDVTNYEKTLTDTLSHYIKWFDDEKIIEINLKKEDSETEYIEVMIEEVEYKENDK